MMLEFAQKLFHRLAAGVSPLVCKQEQVLHALAAVQPAIGSLICSKCEGNCLSMLIKSNSESKRVIEN